jgi:peptidoglycan/LPS O-acetylase OafA/YrhL
LPFTGIQQKLEAHQTVLLGVCLVCVSLVALGCFSVWFGAGSLPWPVYDIFEGFYAWVTILALLGLGQRHLNLANRFTAYMSRSSFSVYMFHQTWIVALAYYVFRLTDLPAVQMALILPGSVAATFASYEICRRIGVARFLFAIKGESRMSDKEKYFLRKGVKK